MTFDELFTFENLYNAHLNARKGKRRKTDVIEFENNISLYIWTLLYRLKNKSYKVSGYNRFYIYEPKKREIQALAYRDRIVQHCLCDEYNKKHGTKGWFLKADIHHFFPSIDHEILKNMLSKLVDDPDILELIFKIIDSFENEPGKGLPMGNQTSQLFALFYLNGIDRIIKEKYQIKYYTRYMDDLILLHDDKQYLIKCLDEIKQYAKDELKLEFNEKTQLIPTKNGVEYVGFHFYYTDSGKVLRRVRTSTKKRYKRKMKKLQSDYAAGEITLKDLQKSIPGFVGHLSRGHTYRLIKSVHSDFVLRQNTEEKKRESR